MEPDSVKQLIASSNQNGIEIIHTEGNWIEVISPATNEEDLKSMGLDTCYKIARISDLIDIEKEQSWESLKYHISQEANETTESGAHDNNTTRVGLGYFSTSMKLKHSSDRRLLRSAGDTAHTREEASVAKPFLFTHYVCIITISYLAKLLVIARNQILWYLQIMNTLNWDPALLSSVERLSSFRGYFVSKVLLDCPLSDDPL